MRNKIFRSLLLLVTAAVVLTGLLFAWASYRQATNTGFRNLQQDARLLVSALDNKQMEPEMLAHLRISKRVTLIAPDGTPLYDNYSNAAQMDNHLMREEVQEALAEGEGSCRRPSATLGVDVLYYAVRLEDGSVLRISEDNDMIWQQVTSVAGYMLLILAIVLGGSLIAARIITARALRPLVQLDLDNPQPDNVYPELRAIVERFAVQQQKLEQEIRRYKGKKKELKAVTNNMDEGLLFLDVNGEVASINKSGIKFFGCEKQKLLGRRVSELKLGEEVEGLMREIKENGKGRLLLTRGSNYYQLNGSRIDDKGIVLLIMDVTERTASEKMRREFSANVSHELKTPLQSVIGYSEIMLNGLVRDGDRQRFLQKIYDEARKLLNLIDDIIKLSHLDELQSDMLQKFTLQDIVRSAEQRLSSKAAKFKVSLIRECDDTRQYTLLGIPSLMEEVVVNLVDNAIKYNKPGGTVTMRLEEKENKYVLRIIDTGIGIAAEELGHIFERFYRVDRSRSKNVEGTGLGLSIVKHGVMFHKGTIKVNSQPGEGTEFVLKFNKK